MRIGPLSITLRDAPVLAPASEPVERKISETEPKGSSGTQNLKGFLLPDEYVSEWRGRRYLDVVDRMVNDGAVEEALGHMKEPVIAALTDIQIEPASEELVDQYAAELCRCSIDWLDQDWQEFCRQALEMLDAGHSVFEVTEQIYQAPLTIEVEQPDGSTATETYANQLWRVPLRYAPRLQKTIWQWHSKNGVLQAITQNSFTDDGDYEQVEIPADDLLVFTFRRKGDNYMGRSILRSAYKAWYLKDIVEKTVVVAIERHGVGVWQVFLDAADADDKEFAGRVEDILANLRSGEFSYALWPRPKATGSGSAGGMTAEIVTPQGGLPTNLVDVAEYFRGDIKAALLTRFSELGHASVGARSVGEVQTEVWHRALESLGALICTVLRERFDKIVQDNLPGARCPKVKPGAMDSKNLKDFAAAIGTLASSGAMEMDRSARAWVRTQAGAPDEDEGTDEDLQKEKEAGRNLPPPPGADPNEPQQNPDDQNPDPADGGGY